MVQIKGIIGLICLAVIISIILVLIQNRREKKRNRRRYEAREQEAPDYQNFFPYQRKYLLTRNEYYFYKKLIPIADNYDLQILTKIRLADLVETKKNLSYVDRNAYFNKIKSKHIDFALVDNMRVVVLIELDDGSHQNQSRIERDSFVDDVLVRCGYIIVHTYGETNLINNKASYYRNECANKNSKSSE